MFEQIVPHVKIVRLRIIVFDGKVFVEVKSDDIFKGQTFFFVKPDELFIK